MSGDRIDIDIEELLRLTYQVHAVDRIRPAKHGPSGYGGAGVFRLVGASVDTFRVVAMPSIDPLANSDYARVHETVRTGLCDWFIDWREGVPQVWCGESAAEQGLVIRQGRYRWWLVPYDSRGTPDDSAWHDAAAQAAQAGQEVVGHEVALGREGTAQTGRLMAMTLGAAPRAQPAARPVERLRADALVVMHARAGDRPAVRRPVLEKRRPIYAGPRSNKVVRHEEIYVPTLAECARDVAEYEVWREALRLLVITMPPLVRYRVTGPAAPELPWQPSPDEGARVLADLGQPSRPARLPKKRLRLRHGASA